jgi:hypothetical protein
MTMVDESPPKIAPLFGPITLEDMRKNDLVAKVAMKLVKDVCAHSKGRYTVQAVADGLSSGVCSLWGIMRPPADLTAIIVTAPNDGVLDVLLAGPDIEDVVPFLPRLDGIARAARCAKLRMMGPGFWKEHLSKDAWRPMFTVYERDLSEPVRA